MSAEIVQFIPRPNPKREEIEPSIVFHPTVPECDFPTDCGNAIWPWPEKDGA